VRLASTDDKGKKEAQLKAIIIYLNRLSDYLFVLSRYCNKIAGVPETLWEK
jgi:cob(I)alamin adenosyltransferase